MKRIALMGGALVAGWLHAEIPALTVGPRPPSECGWYAAYQEDLEKTLAARTAGT